MRIWNINTRSNSIYRVTEDNGVWKFGAVDVPSNGFGTQFLGAEEEIHEPTKWPPVVGKPMTLYFAGHSPAADRYSVISTSPVESVTEVTHGDGFVPQALLPEEEVGHE